MRHIGDSLKRTLDPSKDTERGELMQYFRQRLNQERTPDGYPHITMARMGKMLEQIPTKDLYYLKRVCDDSKNFSKKFWWELKPKEKQPDSAVEQKVAKKKATRSKVGGVRPEDYQW